jgi:hypothetical protein
LSRASSEEFRFSLAEHIGDLERLDLLSAQFIKQSGMLSLLHGAETCAEGLAE